MTLSPMMTIIGAETPLNIATTPISKPSGTLIRREPIEQQADSSQRQRQNRCGYGNERLARPGPVDGGRTHQL